MKPRRAAAVVLRQLYLMRGSPARIMPLFAWVAVDMVLWGFLTRYLNRVASAGFDFVPAFLGAVLLWDFFIRVMQGVSMAFFEDVWARNLLNYFASPMTISDYLTGLVVSSVVTSSVGLAAMLLLGGAVFGLSFAAYGFMALPFALLLFIFGIGLGILATALVLKMGPASEWLIWPIPAIIAPFAGVFYPVSVLPAWMQAVSKILPPSYVFESLRVIVKGGRPDPSALIPAAGLDLLYVLIACFVYTAIYRHAVRTGLIARYSAESVS